MKILILGLPGSGKTTQAKKLSEELGSCFIKTGEILRELAKEDSERGKHLKKIMEEGSLADNKLVSEIVKDRVCQDDCQLGFVMDGFPRDIKQLKHFDPGYDRVFFLDVPVNQLKIRLLKRGREDDTKEAIDKRLEIQGKELESVLAHYSDKMTTIDGSESINKVHSQIKANL